VKRVNKNLIGAFQGIGPTAANSSKRLIANSVNNCKEFLVRDQNSKDLLVSWGAKTNITASFDPAVYVSAKQAAKTTDVIGFGLRRWFHYRSGGFLPTKYRFWEKEQQQTPAETLYREQLVALANQLLAGNQKRLRFFPMHMAKSENDAGFASEIIAQLDHPERCEIVDQDNLSPDQYLSLIAQCQVFVASRLHSAILASVAKVPSLCLYYVDKGRLFFEQLGLSEFAYDINRTQEPGIVSELTKSIELLAQDADVTLRQQSAIEGMRKQLREDLKKAMQL
jgi:polysaccharide pyruvyl transferase WcaK-like protein